MAEHEELAATDQPSVPRKAYEALEQELAKEKQRFHEITAQSSIPLNLIFKAMPDSTPSAVAQRIQDNDRRQALDASYNILTQYDLHYSTVRSAVSTFLIALSIGLAQFALDKGNRRIDLIFMFLVLPSLVLIFNFLLNKYFQSLTWACRLLQTWIEIELSSQSLESRINAIGIPPSIQTKVDRHENLKKDLEVSRAKQHIIFMEMKKRLSKRKKYICGIVRYHKKKIDEIFPRDERQFASLEEPRHAIEQVAKMSARWRPIWHDYPLLYLTIAYIFLAFYAGATLFIRLAPFDRISEWNWWTESLQTPTTILNWPKENPPRFEMPKPQVFIAPMEHPMVIQAPPVHIHNHLDAPQTTNHEQNSTPESQRPAVTQPVPANSGRSDQPSVPQTPN